MGGMILLLSQGGGKLSEIVPVNSVASPQGAGCRQHHDHIFPKAVPVKGRLEATALLGSAGRRWALRAGVGWSQCRPYGSLKTSIGPCSSSAHDSGPFSRKAKVLIGACSILHDLLSDHCHSPLTCSEDPDTSTFWPQGFALPVPSAGMPFS